MDIVKNTNLLSHQKNILTKIALGEHFVSIMDSICLAIEEIIGDSSKCSILILKENRLYPVSAPSLPSKYTKIITGIEIGPNIGSCGTAAFSQSPIFVSDILKSPLWEKYRDLSTQFNFRSCWSIPLISIHSEMFGTLSLYNEKSKIPTDEQIEVIDFFVHLAAITYEKKSQKKQITTLINDLKKTNDKLNAFIKVLPDPAFVLSRSGKYLDIYGSQNELLAKPLKTLINQNMQDVFPPKERQMVSHFIKQALETNQVQVFEYELEVEKGLLTFEGRTIPINDEKSNKKAQVLWLARDITARKQAEKQINSLIYYDYLTNLPNRRFLINKLTSYLSEDIKAGRSGALLFLDIDNFKRVNDSLGHKAGDDLLIELAKRLNKVLRKKDTLARIGGDEFIILLEDVGENNKQIKENTIRITEFYLSIFNDKFNIDLLSFQVSGSIGIFLIENLNTSAEKILQYSDTAMYKAKNKNGNSYSFFEEQFQTLLGKQTELESDIIKAIDNDEIVAYFQPQITFDGNIKSCEALIRWFHPTKGLITPDIFIPIAEQFGLIQKLQNIVLKDICMLINKLASLNLINETYSVALNISQYQFVADNLKSNILSIINEFHIPPSRIKLEITESMFSQDLGQTIQQMQTLVSEGFIFSIDDFGTGYSCLSTLQTYPISELKIDKTFVNNLTQKNITALPIIETIINLASNLNMSVVAEGIETKEQFEALKDKGVDTIQGYYIAKPMSAEDYLIWHSQNS
ncbi:EAL domain-containing protein [Psychromonas aquatilis]|uniref:EAL domain-containing protein n=1 Tax=Psychromonas aquatilis TaxID=2005072 RepID=A0ABU9GSN1_9GAMM